MQNEDDNFYPMAGEDFSLSYNFTAYPDSNIEWWRSRNGTKYVHIASCSTKEVVACDEVKSDEDLKEDITRTRFDIKNLKFPKDDGYYYKCNASNEYGNDSKVFQLHVYGEGNVSLFNAYIYMLLFFLFLFYNKQFNQNLTLNSVGISSKLCSNCHSDQRGNFKLKNQLMKCFKKQGAALIVDILVGTNHTCRRIIGQF